MFQLSAHQNLFRTTLRRGALVLLLALACCVPAFGQTKEARTKLPSPERIVGDYLKAIGGKKRAASIRDARYHWSASWQELEIGSVLMRAKSPAATRYDFKIDGGETTFSANARSAWRRGADDKSLRTLTDAEANAAKLQATLEASHLVSYKKQNVLARTVAFDSTLSEPAYVVEFSMRNGARLRYWFGARSKLLLKISDEARNTTLVFSDYRMEQGLLLEPHRIEQVQGSLPALRLTLQSVSYNQGMSDALFDPPVAETFDIEALLREVAGNQELLDEHVSDYTYTMTSTRREVNGRGEMTKETIRVYEIYPLPGREPARKLISKDGVPLSAEQLAREEKRVAEEIEKAVSEREKQQQQRERARQKGKTEENADEPGIADFLRAAELVSPRRERLRDREAIVFDFRPRPNYRPNNRTESIVSKLAGVVWIDPSDKQVMRLEARLTESYKMGGGLVASVRPGTALVFEQQRMPDGVWLPVFAQFNVSARILLFNGISFSLVDEFSNYQRFGGEFEKYKLNNPGEETAPPDKATDNP